MMQREPSFPALVIREALVRRHTCLLISMACLKHMVFALATVGALAAVTVSKDEGEVAMRMRTRASTPGVTRPRALPATMRSSRSSEWRRVPRKFKQLRVGCGHFLRGAIFVLSR